MYDVKIGWMYPNLLNLHGENGSVQAMVRTGRAMGLNMQVTRIEDFDDPISFSDLDLLIFLPGEISEFPHIMGGLRRQKAQLDAYIEKGGYILALGTTGLMFGNSVAREDGSLMECLGYLDMTARERKYVHGDDLHFLMNGTMQELIGSQIQMADVDAKNPLGRAIYGWGNNGTYAEGARYKNLIYTNCLGPVLVKNPWFSQWLLCNICMKKFLGLAAQPDPLAEASFHSTLKFIDEKPEAL